jgi:hypothetical protein
VIEKPPEEKKNARSKTPTKSKNARSKTPTKNAPPSDVPQEPPPKYWIAWEQNVLKINMNEDALNAFDEMCTKGINFKVKVRSIVIFIIFTVSKKD